MSDLSGIGYLAALIFLFAMGLAILKGIFDLSKNHKKHPKKPDSKPIVSSNSEGDREHDTTYGEDTFEQEDDEYQEEVW